jgi:hypothetical protein
MVEYWNDGILGKKSGKNQILFDKISLNPLFSPRRRPPARKALWAGDHYLVGEKGSRSLQLFWR